MDHMLLILCFIPSGISINLFGPQPRIISNDGHLIFKSAEHRNISFETQGTGRVHVNGIDLTKAAQISNSALQAMAKYQTDFESSFEKISRFEQILDSNDGLFKKLLQGGSGNSSNSADVALILRSVRLLNRKLIALQRRMNVLSTTMSRDECLSNPCQNGGTCQDMFNGFLCLCPKEWEGSTCQKDVNECARFAGTDLGCQNGATCINRQGSYECQCQHGWFGLHCTRRSQDCNSASSLELCGHGSCLPQNSEAGYKCLCDQGWTTDGKTPACNTDVDECASNKPPCSTNPLVECRNLPGTFYCLACPAGYTGNGFYCTDINECNIDNGGCSKNPVVQCVNTIGSRICGNCPPGYVGDGISCSFAAASGICSINNGGCHHLATCRDNPSISATYVQCLCPAGFVGSGIGPTGCGLSTSVTTNPCNSNPCIRGTCSISNVTGSFVCTCPLRYTGLRCEHFRDMCNPDPCLNRGTCISVVGIRARCLCTDSFTGPRCEDEKQNCMARLQQESGTLTYPSSLYGTTTYDHRVSCAWTIETNITKILNITFTRFNVEDARGCQYDWLQIHDGKNTAARSLGRFCGNKLPNGGVITSTHNVIYLWFRTDHSVAQTGFQLNWTSIDPVCGDTRSIKTHGTIQSPGSPGDYPNNRDCYWSLLAPMGKRILFHFFSLIIGDNSDCEHDYLEFISGTAPTDPIFAKFCNTTHPSPLFSAGPEVLIHFHSDATKNYPGFQMTYSVVEGIPGCGGVYTQDHGEIRSPSFEGQYPPDVLCEYKISLSERSRIKITFLSFALEDSDNCNFDRVTIHAGSTSDAPLIGRYCGKTIPPPYTSNDNEIVIVFKTDWASTDEGFVIRYESVCGGAFTQPNGIIESPNYPNQYITGKTCIYEIVQPFGTSISLRILDLDVEGNSYPQCLYDYVEIRDGDSENSTLIGRYCKRKPPVIFSSFNYLWIKFHSDMNEIGRGFQANYTTTKIGCGGILKDKVGTIHSPEHPDIYPPQANCKWIISAPPGNVIQIVWMNFHLEQSFKCTYDSVSVYDNNTEAGMGGLIGKYCGHTSPPILLSSSNVVTIIFTADTTVNLDGFLASYSFIQEQNVCGGNYYTSAGIIKSPNYPKNYPINIECSWTINVEPGHQIMLNITDFDIESYSGCRYDWLEIRNGANMASPLIGKYCGTDIPKLIPSHANTMHLFFKSDMTKSNRGFKIYWDSTTTGCGGSLNAPTGSIISPGYPEPYSVNTECVWQISVSAGSKISIAFTDLDLEVHPNCLLDYIELYDGPSLNSKMIGKYCSPSHPSFVESTSNHVTVKFVSDISHQGQGFQLKYTTMCNNTATGFRGVIESPNFPHGYPHNLNCNWEIKVSAKNKINITFSHFELETSMPYGMNVTLGTCLYDFVQIDYGKVEDLYTDVEEFVKYGTYCGNKDPPLISLNSDHAKVHFVSDNLLIGSGFRLEWQIDGCGGVLTKPKGTITSKNYPKPYPAAVECIWKIQVDFGNSIKITFTDIDIEKDPTCDYDSITIYNGEDHTYPQLASFCHSENNKPVSVISSGNFMYVHFKADASYEGRGFSANYSTQTTKCGGHYTAQTGSIMSPNYPNNFDKNDTCGWLIDIEESNVVEFSFESVDLVVPIPPVNCSANNRSHVTIYDGPTAAYPMITKVCAKNKPNETFSSTHNQVFVEMVSDNVLTSKGFLLKYRKACGARIETSTTGTIKTNSMSFTLEQENCTWTVVAKDPSKHVTLTVTHLDTLYTYCGEDDFPLKIYNGESSQAPLLGEFCGTKIPPTLTSDGSAMRIVLGNSINFFATYSVYDSACGGTLTSIDGFFASPSYPKKYPTDVECEWTISVSQGNHVSLNFLNFELLESDDCNTDYLEIRTNSSAGKLLGVFCGTNTPTNISHMGSLWIFLKTSHVSGDQSLTTAKGFYAEYALNTVNELFGPSGIIASPLYPESYGSFKEFAWKITVHFGKRILLTFKEFYLEVNLDTYCYLTRLEVYDGADDTATLLGTFCGITIPDPIKSTSNVVYIKVSYSVVKFHSKFLLEWLQLEDKPTPPVYPNDKKEKCGAKEPIDLNELKNYTQIESPGYPNGYKGNLECEWIFSTIPMNHLKVTFTFVDLEKTYMSRCYLDYIEVYERTVVSADWKSLKKVCYDNYTTVETTNLMKVIFKTNGFINGTGFTAKIKEECGGSLTDESGFISFDNNTAYFGYSYMKSCQWNVTVKSGRTIQIDFIDFDIYHDNSGCNNYLMLRNGLSASSPLLGNGKYCGSVKPPVLKTTGNHLYLKYSGEWNVKGFKLSYREVSFECGGQISLSKIETTAQINSPNYPNIPSPHTECNWIIIGPPGEILRLDFVDRFDLTESTDCKKELVEVRDGGTISSPLVGKYCGAMPTSPFTTDNVMFVRFFTDIDDPSNGFRANINIAKCGGTIRGKTGEILSPFFNRSNNYPKNYNCTWHIVAPLDHNMKLTFTKIDLPVHPITKNCSYVDHVEITESNLATQEVTRLGDFCGKTTPEPIETSSNEVTVHFETGNRDFHLSGFALKFNASVEKCGGNIEASTGFIQSPGYPVQHKIYRFCEWFIKVPPGRRVTLSILDLDIDQRKSRRESIGLALFNDRDYRSTIAFLKPSDSRKVISSSENFMLIYYWAHGGNRRGFKAEFNSDEPTVCEGNFGENNGVITQPQNTSVPYFCTYTRTKTTGLNTTLAISIRGVFNSTNPKYKIYSCEFTSAFLKITTEDVRQIIALICLTTPESTIVRSPYPITKILASQSSIYRMNFTLSYKEHPCGGVISGETGTLSSPNFPNAYSNSKAIECAWLLTLPKEQTVQVTIKTLNLGTNCESSYLDIYNGNLPTKPKIGRYCQNNIPGVIRSQTNNVLIEYKADPTVDNKAPGTGFSLDYEPIINGCGGIFHDATRLIQTPSFPNNYPSNAECLWEIVSEEGFHIGLKFISRFHVESSDNCQNDYVEVWDWKDDSWVSFGKKCGREIPETMNSTSNRMKILFRSNEQVAGAGFKAQWELNCGGTFAADLKQRFILSPGFPTRYKPNMNCQYNISTPVNKFVNIKFHDFNIEGGSPECKYDNVTVSNVAFIYKNWAAPKQIYCGSTVPPDFRFSHAAYISFKTDAYVQRQGFRFSYQLESCGGAIKAPSMVFSPPLNNTRRPMEYQGYVQCQWNITAPLKKIVVIQFERFELAMRPNCYFDNVDIFEGINTDPLKRIANLCGNLDVSPPVIKSVGNTVLMRLRTDRTSNMAGFKANVYFTDGPDSGCGGKTDLTATETITAPNLEDMDCTWLVSAPQGYNIKVQLKEMNLPASCSIGNHTIKGCRCAVLELRDGASPVSEQIEKFCATTTENNENHLLEYVTSGRTLSIRLYTRGAVSRAFKASLTKVTSICGPLYLNATDQVQTLTSPNYPGHHGSIRCTWQIRSAATFKIVLHFLDFDLLEDTAHHTTNQCAKDKLQVIDDPSSQIISNGLGPQTVIGFRRTSTEFQPYNPVYGTHQFCGKSLPFDYYTTREAVIVTFSSSGDETSQSRGFKLQYQQVACNRNFTSEQGRIVSSKMNDCYTTITVPKNSTISLYFQYFLMVQTPNCDDVGMEIRDGGDRSSKSFMKLCGYALPNPIFSTTNKLWIHSWNKRTISYVSTYDIVYTSSDKGKGCGGTMYNYKGRFTSPLFPVEYKKSDLCKWNVRVPIGMRVALKFIVFDIQGNCDDNYVKVTTKDGENSLEHKFCKDDNPATLYSTSQADVTYQSSLQNGGRGWIAVFEAVN